MSEIHYVSASPALLSIRGLPVLLDKAQVSLYARPWHKLPTQCNGVLVWGKKPSARKGEQLAQRLNLPLLRLEDGFLRSVELGSECAPYSVVLDDVGIYYDAAMPSRLEQLIPAVLSNDQQQRARNVMQLWQRHRVSKYNHSRETKTPDRPYVLVVDQTYGDASITYGLANADSFRQMLSAAKVEYPEHLIVLKIHPDVFAGKKQGHFDAAKLAGDANIMVLTEDIHAPALLEHASAVFCVTSQMGFEALLWQKPVYTFGMPFYAGWGLTTDALDAPARRTPVKLEQLIYASLITYPKYLHPETAAVCEVETLIAWMGMQRSHRERFAVDLYLAAVPLWKRKFFSQFFQGSRLHFLDAKEPVPSSLPRVVWGAKAEAGNVIRVEDGFLRSVGLGADLIRPASWVLDPTGMYYDAQSSSALEHLLSEYEFDDAILTRAAALQQQLIKLNVTKYNVGRADWVRPKGKHVILVPGQVESDASIQCGSVVLKTNQALLKAVRDRAADSYILYKPHPDVLAGLRKAGNADMFAAQYCDEVITDQDMAHMLSQVDEVHTLTSLTGFEALMRGLKVYCYGQPFYAGWGLTTDIYPHPGRQRKRSMAELVAAALILYPTYVSATTGYYTTPERIIDELKQQRQVQGNINPWWRPLLRRVLALKRF